MLCALSKSTKTFATRSCFAGPIDIKIHANMYFMSICPLAHHIQGKKCIECSLRPLAVVNAFFNGRYAEQNGRSCLADC